MLGLLRCFPLFVLFAVGLTSLSAQEVKPKKTASKPKAHPATRVVQTYLGHLGARRWEPAVKMMDPVFLKRAHADYIMRVRRSLSMDDEVKLLKVVGVERLRDLEGMTPAQFYVARQKMQDAAKLTPETRKRMAETSKVEVLGAVAESPTLVHVIARHSQETLKEELTEMVMISLEKQEDGKWRVSPSHQNLQVKPIKIPGVE